MVVVNHNLVVPKLVSHGKCHLECLVKMDLDVYCHLVVVFQDGTLRLQFGKMSFAHFSA